VVKKKNYNFWGNGRKGLLTFHRNNILTNLTSSMHEISVSEENSLLVELSYVQEQLNKCVLPSTSSYILTINLLIFNVKIISYYGNALREEVSLNIKQHVRR
jgi:hypothetical protein